MRSQQLEATVLSALDRLRAGQPLEDDRIELKREWPLPDRPRQLAGAANRANGEPMIYIIGVDEKTGDVVHPGDVDPATWWSRLSSRFDEVHPELLLHLNIPVGEGGSVVAMLFGTDRAPYVVKAPSGGAVEREVPMRDGTRTRSIKRNELVRMLAAQVSIPPAQILDAELTLTRSAYSAALSLSGFATIFLEHTEERNLLLPLHRCAGRVTLDDVDHDADIALFGFPSREYPAPTYGVYAAGDGIVATGPGSIRVRIEARPTDALTEETAGASSATLRLDLGVAGTRRALTLHCELRTVKRPRSVSVTEQTLASWTYSA